MNKVQYGKYNFNSEVWVNVSPDAKDFITQLLTKDQDKRRTAEQAPQLPRIL